MNTKQLFPFLVGVVFSAWILALVPFNEEKVLLRRLADTLHSEFRLNHQMKSRCESISAGNQAGATREFLLQLGTQPSVINDSQRVCRIYSSESRTQRFYLYTQAVYVFRLADNAGVTRWENTYRVYFPRPLALLPLVALGLALLFQVPLWRLGWALGAYLLCLTGLNLIHSTELALSSFWLTLWSDKLFLSLAPLILWVALNEATSKTLAEPRAIHPLETWLNRLLCSGVGLWSPGSFTGLGKLFFPTQSSLASLRIFFDAQAILCTLSLFFLGARITRAEFSLETLLLPRYFSFALLLFFGLAYLNSPKRSQFLLWQLPHFSRKITFVVVIEILALLVPALRSVPTLSRIGLALILSDLTRKPKIDYDLWLSHSFRWIGGLFLSAFAGTVCIQSGLLDMALAIWEPKAHPNIIVIFTFLSGICVGFLTGNFSTTLFALLTVSFRGPDRELTDAALLDGILAGSLLSPFSIYNLLPATQFKISLREMIQFRWKQLWLPLLLGSSIYAISLFSSVGILRPVTFAFLCLVGMAMILRRGKWQLQKMLDQILTQ